MHLTRPSSGDIVAGISVALLALPQGLAYAELAGMPAKYGLFAAALPSLFAAVFASSPYLQTGPVALTALLTYGALQGLSEPFSEEFIEPTSIILKHTNPCGVASAKNIEIAFNRSYESDPKSAFGGIILLNRKVTSKLAKKIYKNFFEMIVALDFDQNALKILEKKKNLILLKIPNI